MPASASSVPRAVRRNKGKEDDRPNKHTDRAAWNRHFEREISRKYAAFSYTSPPFENSTQTKLALAGKTVEELNQDVALSIREMMEAEGVLIAEAVEDINYGTLEADWAALGAKKRGDIVLEGLYRGACYAPRDNSRIHCPEMTVALLAGDGQYGFINMLKKLIKHDPTGNGRVKELFIFSHPYVEHELRHTKAASDGIRAFLYHARMLRNYYIVDTLQGVLEAYHNRPARVIKPAKLVDTCHHGGKEGRRAFDKAFKASGLHVDNSQCDEEAANAVYACYGCRREKPKDELKECAGCLRVRYCSRECQKSDWQEHKKFCGREDFDPARLMPEPEPPAQFIGCPAPVEGYIRTPALWRQIGYLSKPDSQNQDYHFNIAPDRTRSVFILAQPGVELEFLVARRRAMASGCPAAVNVMLEILTSQWRDGLVGNLTLQQIRSQLETEYRVKIHDGGVVGAGPYAWPTKMELEEEQEYLRQRLLTATAGEEYPSPRVDICPCCGGRS
ncbi:hypothetical protein C8R46DRAFT_1186200 [Mycena filopes]|nr:hypothetical protein C8R46DRAFT_1186200 [Mycena filopes]